MFTVCLQDQIDNAGLKDMIATLIDKVPRIKGPLEPDSIPPLDLSQDSEEGMKNHFMIEG